MGVKNPTALGGPLYRVYDWITGEEKQSIIVPPNHRGGRGGAAGGQPGHALNDCH